MPGPERGWRGASSTQRTVAPDPLLVAAVQALREVVQVTARECRACAAIAAEGAAGRQPDPRVERDHRRNCAGVVAWAALARILRTVPPPPPTQG